LGGKYGEPTRSYAARLARQQDEARPVDGLLRQSADELAYLAEVREWDRREAIKARAQFSSREVSPFGPGGAPTVAVAPPPKDPPTERQVWFLVRRLGWRPDSVQRLSKRQASAIIGKAKGD